MNLQQLEYFKVVAETENFTIASKLLSVTQPALSKAISNLETELNISLFDKIGRNIKLNNFGKKFLFHTNIALSELKTGIKELEYMANLTSDSVRVSSSSTIGTYFMPNAISEFLALNSSIKFKINHKTTEEIIIDLKSHHADLGFYYHPQNDPEIECVPIKKEDYVLIVPKGHRLANESHVSLKELKDEKFIVFCESNNDRVHFYNNLLGYIPNISVQPNDASMIENLVIMGSGISVVPRTPLLNSNKLSIIELKEPFKESIIYMGWLKDSYISPSSKVFKEYILSKYSL